ncbi:MAG TPA: CoA ester lyase [Anaerolineaceae bacterium]|nr:CoA ester lyase [Anaerolineaceae bacterium]
MQTEINHARRAMMYVPGNDLHKIEKAAALNVDAVILDLEDGVAPGRKDEARQVIRHALESIDFGRTERFVRINALASGRGEADLQAIVPGTPDGILVPKVDDASIPDRVDQLLSSLEKEHRIEPGSISIAATIEGAIGFLNLRDICQSSPRLQALVFGAEDFTADTGITRTREAQELLLARSLLVLHGAAFGLSLIDMVQTAFSDMPLLEAECQRGTELGFTGKQVIHPAQVETVQRVFSPSEKAIAHALRVVESAHQAQSEGRGAFALDGHMVDAPVVKRAENILRRARAAGMIS